MQQTDTSRGEPDSDTLDLWYALGRLYAGAAPSKHRSARLGFTVTLISGAAVLLSAPLIGTSWAGPLAPAVPVILGLIAGFGMFIAGRFGMRRAERDIREALQRKNLDPDRPTADGLGTYYDSQLVLLRSEYEYLLEKGAKRSARLLERAFGFLPDDPFETGPLSVRPDTGKMRRLRERWERRLAMVRVRSDLAGSDLPKMGLREDLAYRVFPREMTVPAEMATREAYLTVSISLLRKRYGRRDTLNKAPENLKTKIRRDFDEYAALTRRTYPQMQREPRSGQPPEGRN